MSMRTKEDCFERAREIARELRERMDPVCREHFSGMEYHPLSDEFSGTGHYNEFERLLWEYIDTIGEHDPDEVSATIEDEYRTELREKFDEEFYGYWDRSECVKCRAEKDIIVIDPDKLTPERILDGKVQSAATDESDDETARWR